MSLNDYMQKNIFQPLGLANISMFPNESMKSRLAHMQFRNTDGSLSPNDHIHRRPLIIKSDAEKEACLNSGGAGCFASPQEYCRKFTPPEKFVEADSNPEILAVLLNDGTSPKTGAQILQKSTVDEMFRNQIPELPDFGRQGIPDSKKWLTNALTELYPVAKGEPQGWGLTFMLSGSATGRSTGAAYWSGLPNCYWWCDREKGVAGLVTSQILPCGDLKVLELWAKVEMAVYGGLDSVSSEFASKV